MYRSVRKQGRCNHKEIRDKVMGLAGQRDKAAKIGTVPPDLGQLTGVGMRYVFWIPELSCKQFIQ